MKAYLRNRLMSLAALALLAMLSTNTFATQEGTTEFSLLIPYLDSTDINFKGGTSAKIDSDPGFGFGFAYNYSSNLAGRIDMTWNSTSYSATRILDDGSQTSRSINGQLETFSISVGGDYYFMDDDFSPFVNGNLGWNIIDTNIADGPPSTACWWDPWYGYICNTYQSTRREDSVFYSLGAGLRMEVGRGNFLKLGYYESWPDIENASGSPSLGTIRLEIGFKY